MTIKNPITSALLALILLGVAFVALKLTGVIDWSWWSVTAPFWAIAASVIVATVIALLLFLVAEDVDHKQLGVQDR